MHINRIGVPLTVIRVLKGANAITVKTNQGQELHRAHRRGAIEEKSLKFTQTTEPESL